MTPDDNAPGNPGIDEYIAKLVAEAPPLSADQRARLASLLSES
jgi:hypothetical protein